MLDRLIRLYSRNYKSGNTPLEDFTTEALASILLENEELKKSFLYEFLELPVDRYQILTQKKHLLEGHDNCIIDMVMLGSENVSFIENKVNSKEGYGQLERYSLVLDQLKAEGKKTYLFYCTKYTDSKTLSSHNFQQYRWHELAYFLDQEDKDTLTSNFLSFLKQNDMSNDTTLYSNDFVVFENIQSTLNKCYEMLDSVKPTFQDMFCKNLKVSEGKTTAQIRDWDRVIYSVKNFVKGDGYSEINFGLYFKETYLSVELYCDKKNPNYDSIIEHFDKSGIYKVEKYDDVGSSIWLEMDLSTLLNQENSDETISTWFKDSFDTFAKSINDSKLDVWNK